MTGLTTGAITHILDRRKVFVRVREESVEILLPKYEAVGKAYTTLLEQYSDQELRLICDYMEKTAKLLESELTRVIAAHRSHRKKA